LAFELQGPCGVALAGAAPLPLPNGFDDVGVSRKL
jgi:hypothetical protein